VKRTDRFFTGGPFGIFRSVSTTRRVFVGGLLLLTSCSVVDNSTEQRPPPSAATPRTSITATGNSGIADIADNAEQAVGLVTIDDESFALNFDCYAAGAGEIVAIGSTTDPDGQRIEVYLQAFLAEPYLAISIINESTQLLEAAIDRPLEISVSDQIVRVDDISLVTGLDLQTGESEAAGVGSVVVECRSYSPELPPGFGSG